MKTTFVELLKKIKSEKKYYTLEDLELSGVSDDWEIIEVDNKTLKLYSKKLKYNTIINKKDSSKLMKYNISNNKILGDYGFLLKNLDDFYIKELYENKLREIRKRKEQQINKKDIEDFSIYELLDGRLVYTLPKKHIVTKTVKKGKIYGKVKDEMILYNKSKLINIALLYKHNYLEKVNKKSKKIEYLKKIETLELPQSELEKVINQLYTNVLIMKDEKIEFTLDYTFTKNDKGLFKRNTEGTHIYKHLSKQLRTWEGTYNTAGGQEIRNNYCKVFLIDNGVRIMKSNPFTKSEYTYTREHDDLFGYTDFNRYSEEIDVCDDTNYDMKINIKQKENK